MDQSSRDVVSIRGTHNTDFMLSQSPYLCLRNRSQGLQVVQRLRNGCCKPKKGGLFARSQLCRSIAPGGIGQPLPTLQHASQHLCEEDRAKQCDFLCRHNSSAVEGSSPHARHLSCPKKLNLATKAFYRLPWRRGPRPIYLESESTATTSPTNTSPRPKWVLSQQTLAFSQAKASASGILESLVFFVFSPMTGLKTYGSTTSLSKPTFYGCRAGDRVALCSQSLDAIAFHSYRRK